jgi:hypothetical protein
MDDKKIGNGRGRESVELSCHPALRTHFQHPAGLKMRHCRHGQKNVSSEFLGLQMRLVRGPARVEIHVPESCCLVLLRMSYFKLHHYLQDSAFNVAR